MPEALLSITQRTGIYQIILERKSTVKRTKFNIITEEDFEYISMIYDRPELQLLLRVIKEKPADKQEEAINLAINTLFLLGGARP